MALDQRLSQCDQTLRLVAEEARAPDHLLELLWIGIGERLCSWKSSEDERRHHVDALVGALRAEDCRNQQLEGRFVIELSVRVGIGPLKTRENFERV